MGVLPVISPVLCKLWIINPWGFFSFFFHFLLCMYSSVGQPLSAVPESRSVLFDDHSWCAVLHSSSVFSLEMAGGEFML